MNDIIEYSISQEENKFVKKGIDVEIETFGDMLSECENIPYIGTLYKLGKTFTDFRDLQFVKRLAKFLSKSESIPYEVKEKFVHSLTDTNRKRVSDFLMNSLYNCEEDIKAEILGYVYKYRLLGLFSEGETNAHIENDYMFRICHGINLVYAWNLQYLSEYKEERANDGISADDLYHAGFLSMRVSGTRKIPSTPETLYQLNVYGCKLDEILCKENWYDNQM